MKLYNRKERLKLRDTREFKSTNQVWNKLNLNHIWVIGFMTSIIKKKDFSTFEEWESYYLSLGDDRQKKLSKLTQLKASKLKDLTAPYTNPYHYKKNLSREDIELNTYNGRTLDEMKHLGKFMHQHLKRLNYPSSITEELCYNYVYIRIVDEIYIGVERENNTLAKLVKLFPNFEFKFADEITDKKYAVDIEVFYEGSLIVGFQVKSEKYKKNNEQILKETKSYNLTKNKMYEDLKGVPVIYIYSTVSGYILDNKAFTFLNTYKKAMI